MTEKEIQLLGFEVNYDDGGGAWDKYHYYSYTVASGFEFISNASDEVGEDGKWYVDFFDSNPTIRFTEFGEVQSLINLLEKRIIKSE
jgi:hypothetical protein